MNIIQSELSVRPWGRFRAWQLAIACAGALVVAGVAGAGDLGRDVSVVARPAEAKFISNSEEPAIATIYQAAESEGLVPDEARGGFRSPANLRERLQAQRGDFSNALR